jgi:tRNA-specific 2-thiouridylase
MADARRVAQFLSIPFYVVDAQHYFYDTVVRYFMDEHAAARTPNPCIACNRQVRFGFLLDRALAVGADFLATGHYARVSRDSDGYQLLRARDSRKDQSYVLHVLGQLELERVMFPIGDYTKEEVRQLARRRSLPVAEKSESMDLCFLGDGDYRRFLRHHAPESFRPGPIINQAGHELGRHQGLANYTTGQRKGLGLATGQPLYVLAKDVGQNALVVGTLDDLGASVLSVKDVNWVAGGPPEASMPLQVKIRYRATATLAKVLPVESDRAEVHFSEAVTGATAGQGAVFYDGDTCVGGGIIADVRKS